MIVRCAAPQKREDSVLQGFKKRKVVKVVGQKCCAYVCRHRQQWQHSSACYGEAAGSRKRAQEGRKHSEAER